jgi:tetratricopeptide (TPR) repeat protein
VNRLGAWLIAALVATGCAARGPLLGTAVPPATRAVELAATPFFAQDAHQCGPAALATVLGAAGREVSPTELADQVFLPGRTGSLQVELVAATRRHGRIPYVIEPRLDALLAELLAGRPVLVLQNLGFEAYPSWHYAVVIGFDPGADSLILRSGIRQREVLSARRFVGTWQRADFWGLVALTPGELPARPDRTRYLEAVAAVEGLGQLEAALAGYRAALERWPDDPVALLGYGNSHYGLGRRDAARDAYLRLVQRHPRHAAGHNNLAQVLADLGDYDGALAVLASALSLGEAGPELQEALRQTQQEVLRRRAGAGPGRRT